MVLLQPSSIQRIEGPRPHSPDEPAEFGAPTLPAWDDDTADEGAEGPDAFFAEVAGFDTVAVCGVAAA
jgi:hypothetical protein